MYKLKLVLILVASLQVDAKLRRGGASELDDSRMDRRKLIQTANALIAESALESSSFVGVRGLDEVSVTCPTAIAPIYQSLGNDDIQACATNADCAGFEPTDGWEACW